MLDYLTTKTQAVLELLADPAYEIAARYFVFNTIWVLLALAIGLGALSLLLKNKFLKKNTHTGITLLPGTVAMLAITTGLAIMLAELFLLALLHVMTPGVTACLYAVTAALMLGLTLTDREVTCALLPRNHSCLVMGVTLVFIGILAVMQFAFIGIASGYDSIAFHVPYADLFVKNHGLAVDEHLIYPFHTFNINLFFSLALMIEHNIIYVQTVHSLFAALSVLGVYMFCREAGQRLWLAIAMALFFSRLYIICVSRFMANVDLGSMFFVLMAVFALYLWSGRREATWLLICSAISFGVAMGSKYIIVVMALPIALCILFQERRDFLRPLLIYMAWAAVFGLWWYIRNWVYTGNPVHPFATGIFGYYLWNATDMAGQMSSLNQVYLPRDLMQAPWFPIFAYYNEVLHYQDAYPVIWMLYASTLSAAFFAWPGSGRINALLVFCWIYFVSWLFGSQDPRHLMPIMPLVFVHSGAVCNQLWSMLSDVFGSKYGEKSFWKFTEKYISILLVLFILGCAARDARGKFMLVRSNPLQAGAAQDAALRKNLTIDLFYAANEAFTENDTVLDMGVREGRWFFKGHVVGNQFGPHGYMRVMDSVVKPEGGGLSPARLEKLLRENYHAQGFLIPDSQFFNTAEFDAYFDMVYRNDRGSVYRLRNP